MNPLYARVAQRALHRCEYCQAPEAIFNFPFEVEHIVPPGAGGSNEDSNLALSCRACNVYKSIHHEAIDPDTEATVPLFNPRKDNWEINFRVDRESGVVEGLTPCGRPTVQRLRMNRPAQLSARKQWIRLNIFP